MNVILSIKPKYCDAIRKGQKKFEFRRKIFQRKPEKVYMYSTSPVKKIVGSFGVKEIIEDSPKELWYNYGNFSGLSENEFFDYFDGSETGFAIAIKDVNMFTPINPKGIIPNFVAPQSYCYLKHEVNLIKERMNSSLFFG